MRQGGSPGALSQVTSAAAPGDARGTSSTRGAEDSLPATTIGQTLSAAMTRFGDAYEFNARITGYVVDGDNKWKYQWEEVTHADTPGTYTTVSGGRTHSTHGLAYNSIEAPNSGSGLQGNGIDVGDLPVGMEMQPIATASIHTMTGPYGTTELPWVRFSCPNAVGGECE